MFGRSCRECTNGASRASCGRSLWPPAASPGRAGQNKGRHREKAIQLVDQAMQEVQQGEKYDQRRPKQSEIKAEISTLHVRASGRWSGTRESIMVSVAKRTAPTLSPNVQQRLAFVHQKGGTARCDCHRWVRRSNRSLASIGCSLSSRLTRVDFRYYPHSSGVFPVCCRRF